MYDLRREIEKTKKMEDVVDLLVDFDRNDLMSECSNLREVFHNISRSVSFFDYDIVKLLTNNLGSKRLKKRLHRYKEKFQEFSKRRICELPCDAFGDAVGSEKRYVIKIDKSLDTLTVEQLATLHYKMNAILGHELLQLRRFEDGCVQLTFRTLKKGSLKITPEAQQRLRKLGVLNVHFGDQFVDVAITDISSFGKLLYLQ